MSRAPAALRNLSAESSSSHGRQGRGRRVVPTEHQSQVAFFQWWAYACQGLGIHPTLCYAVPNGGGRSKGQAGRLKAEGVQRGVPDVALDVARGGFHGLRLEFKRPGGRPTPEQEAHLYHLRKGGYNAMIVWSTDEAIKVVLAYLA